ncbi:NAD(P)H-dependent flavin oxidoreductase [Sinosporangium siamense]|uniref:Probable nitronate monooxygenase n=1 Tax=Sinosporangium siamense TaxID=1367973 RepID=A0A919VFA3_9ACTN|nr:nitronate monooxygenase [Sinosporangium siamense]GII95929.1 nitronate monooxygenase [Sinosporangium siamense]
MSAFPWSGGRLEALLGLDHPIVQGPFGGGYSSVALAAAVADAGGLGSFGAYHLGPDAITGLVADLKAATSRAFAVNLWVPQPGERDLRARKADVDRLRPCLEELGLDAPALGGPYGQDFRAQIEALLDAAPPAVSFIMGVPPRDVLERARRLGIVTIGTATTVDEAVALQEAGLSAVVASGSDAGGHRGSFLRPAGESLVGTFSLVPQVADAVSVPVIAAGGIADGRGVAAALTLGADGVQIGTGFLATAESGASEVHKAALRGPDARVTVLTRLFSGRLARAIPNRFVREMAAFEDQVPPYPVQNALMLPIRRASTDRGLPDHVNLWSGQSAALTRPCDAKSYVDALLEETTAILAPRLGR